MWGFINSFAVINTNSSLRLYRLAVRILKADILILIMLIISLLIYLFYRPDYILVNQFWTAFFGVEPYHSLKHLFSSILPLPHWVIYNLPEGLWLFCFTLSLRYMKYRNILWRLVVNSLPIIFLITLELFQKYHISKGIFDVWDIIIGLTGWLFAVLYSIFLLKPVRDKRYIKPLYIARCCIVFFIVYLAHWVH